MSKSTLMKKLMDEQNVFRSEVMVIKEVNDEIQKNISYIKDELQNSIEIMYRREEKKEKQFWLHGNGLKELLTMNIMGKTLKKITQHQKT